MSNEPQISRRTMLGESCRDCRFWLAQPKCGACPIDGTSVGLCRRYPPTISDHMAGIAIGTIRFGSNQIAPEDIADAMVVHDATLFPAKGYHQWCGEFVAAPPAAADAVNAGPQLGGEA